MQVLGSIFDPNDKEMWLQEPHKPINMSVLKRREWRQLIKEAGIDTGRSRPSARKDVSWYTEQTRAGGPLAPPSD